MPDKVFSAAVHDHVFLKDLDLKKGSSVVFDKVYVDYEQYQQWTLGEIYFVTTQSSNARFTRLEEFDIPDNVDDVVLKDEKITLTDKQDNKFHLRRIVFWHQQKRKVYEFITKNYQPEADKITDIHKNRWQIETMFKRLKQNFPLKYFLVDNHNAIEIQIWVSPIIQLIMLFIQRKTQRR